MSILETGQVIKSVNTATQVVDWFELFHDFNFFHNFNSNGNV